MNKTYAKIDDSDGYAIWEITKRGLVLRKGVCDDECSWWLVYIAWERIYKWTYERADTKNWNILTEDEAFLEMV